MFTALATIETPLNDIFKNGVLLSKSPAKSSACLRNFNSIFENLVDFLNYFPKNYDELPRILEHLYCRIGVLIFLIGMMFAFIKCITIPAKKFYKKVKN